jgi:hypothetical protein
MGRRDPRAKDVRGGAHPATTLQTASRRASEIVRRQDVGKSHGSGYREYVRSRRRQCRVGGIEHRERIAPRFALLCGLLRGQQRRTIARGVGGAAGAATSERGLATKPRKRPTGIPTPSMCTNYRISICYWSLENLS